MTDTEILAPHSHHRRRAKTKTLRTQDGGFHHIEAGLHAAICLQPHLAAQTIAAQGLLYLGNSQLPGRTGIPDRGQRARRRTPVVTRNGDQIRVGLCHTCGNGPNARLRDQLYRHQRIRIHLLEIEDELCQILDRVNVMVRWRRNQGHAWHRIAQSRNQVVDFAAWQLPALSGLGTLSYLDLEHLGIHQIVRRHTEAARRDLFDFGDPVGTKAVGIFTALAAVRACTDLIHPHGQRLMGLWRQRPQGHTGGIKAAQNIVDRLHLIEGHRLVSELEGQQIAQCRNRSLVTMARIALIVSVIPAHHRRLQAHDHVGVVGVVLTAMHVLQQAALIEGFAARARPARHLPLIFFQLIQRHTANARGDTSERNIDQLAVEPHRFKQLGTAIRVHRRDAHLGHDLQKAFVNALTEILLAQLRITEELAAAQQILDHAVGQIRIDSRRTEAQQTGHMMRVPRCAGLHH